MQCLETLGQKCTLKKHEYIRISKRMRLYRIVEVILRSYDFYILNFEKIITTRIREVVMPKLLGFLF